MNAKYELMAATLSALPSATAPDPDDLAGVYLRRAADGNQHRCRFRQPARGRHRGNGGMISATMLAIFFVPLFFVLVRRRQRAKGASAINRRALSARRNNRKRRPRWSILYVFSALARFIYFRVIPCSHCGNFIYEACLQFFPVPQFMFNHNSLSYYAVDSITSLPM